MQKEKQLGAIERSRNVPQLRFPKFEGEWIKSKLRKKIHFISGYAFKSKYMSSVDDKYQLIKMSNVYKSELHLDRNPSYWGDIDHKLEKFLLKKNDIILTLTGTVGKKDYGYSIQINESNRFLLNQRLVCLRGIQNASNSSFLNSLIKTSKFYYSFFSESKGGTGNQSNVGVEDLRNITLFFPKIEEQQKIADFLSAVDTRIQNLEKKKALLAQYKKGVMQQIFKQAIRFKDDEGNDFPEWEKKKLGDVCSKSSSNISANKIEDNFGEYVIYGASGALKKIDFYKEENDYVSIIKDGAGVGRIFYCKGKSSVLGTMEMIKPKKDLNTFFLYCLLGRINFKKYVTGSTIPHIYFKDYKKEKCGVPALKEQTKIANFLSAIDQKIALVYQQIEKTETYKKGLLQQLFV